MTATTQAWDASGYNKDFAFVWEFGRGLLDLLAAQPGERVLDLGCGTGHLTAEIAGAGAIVEGIDRDAEMLEQARAAYPEITFRVAPAEAFTVSEPVDAVFSNAVLHWVPQADAAARCIAAALRPGGRLVAEFGGYGNVETVLRGVAAGLRAVGSSADGLSPWYYPSIAEYAAVLERAGLEPRTMVLFDRPTPLEGGEDGLRGWIRMFGGSFLAAVPTDGEDAFFAAAEDEVRGQLFADGQWTADYRRLRLVAVKG